MEKEYTEIIKNEIAPLLEDGDLTLYIGAGVSIGTKTINNLGVPSTPELIERICKEIELSDTEASQADLPTAFGVGADEIDNFENFLIGNFTISDPKQWQIDIFKYWWRAIFTTNIDDLPAKCLAKLQYKTNQFPQFNIFSYRDKEPVTTLATNPPIVHLHGYITKPRDGFVFDSVHYADVTIKHNGWINKSGLHISHGHCVFVGSKFKESDIEAAIRQRTLWESDTDETQPTNWIVLRKFTALEKKAYTKRGFIPIEAEAEDFFKTLFANVSLMTPTKFLKRKAPHLIIDKANPSTAWFTANISNVTQEIESAKKRNGLLSRFYYGDIPDWFYISKDVPAYFQSMREIESEILQFENSAQKTLLISAVGPLGSGKTTACMTSLANLAKTHNNIYFFSGINALDIEHTWRVIKDMRGLVVIFVDAASSTFYAINEVIRRVLDKPSSCKLCFLIEERTVQFKRNLHHLSSIPKTAQKLIEIDRLAEEDAAALLDKAAHLGVSYEKLTSLDRQSSIKKIIDSDSGYKGDLLATLYDLSSSKSYQEKLTEEFDEIQDKHALETFLTLTLVSACKLAIPINYLAESHNFTINYLMEILEKELKGKIYINRQKMMASARHHSIAEFHIKNSFDKEKIKTQIISLMHCMGTKFEVNDIKHHPISYKIYSKILSQYFLTETVFPSKNYFPFINEIYASCQTYFAADGIFWLQYGRFLEKTHKIDDALHCFRKGLALYDSFQIRHALGQVLIKKYRTSSKPDRRDLEEGIQFLQFEIEQRGSIDSYPYTALGNELIRLLRNAKEDQYCENILRDTINRGLKIHSRDEVFMKMVTKYLQLNSNTSLT